MCEKVTFQKGKRQFPPPEYLTVSEQVLRYPSSVNRRLAAKSTGPRSAIRLGGLVTRLADGNRGAGQIGNQQSQRGDCQSQEDVDQPRQPLG